MRLDHLLLSPDLARRLTVGGVDRWVRGEANASDHAPAWIELDRNESGRQVFERLSSGTSFGKAG